eukprot:436627-Rhodomonas_salina.1
MDLGGRVGSGGADADRGQPRHPPRACAPGALPPPSSARRGAKRVKEKRGRQLPVGVLRVTERERSVCV